MECRNCDYYKAKNCKHQCMLLPDGMTCGDCINIDWCSKVYGVKPEYTSCDFEPIRFKAKEKEFNHGRNQIKAMPVLRGKRCRDT